MQGLYGLDGVAPDVADPDRLWVAPGAQVMGRVTLGRDVGVWFNAVIRGDIEPIEIGDRTNIQDGAVLHTERGAPLVIGAGCTIGHGVILHGCTIGADSLIGMGATVLNRARIGANCLVGANALVTEGKVFPDGSLIIGSPATAVRPLTPAEIDGIRSSAERYVANARRYRVGLAPVPESGSPSAPAPDAMSGDAMSGDAVSGEAMSGGAHPTAAVLVVGDEILSGRTKDANLGWLAERLFALGIGVREARVVPDVADEIIAAVNALRSRYSYVFTTGGIGPTHDDITAECIAKAFGVALERNAEAVRRLELHYEPGQLNEARLRMANIPTGGVLIDNPISVAPGFRIGNVIVLAGVPSIMQAMFEGIACTLKGGPPLFAMTVRCQVPEGQLAAGLAAIQADYPDVTIGSYPYMRLGQFGTSLVQRGRDKGRVAGATAAVQALVEAHGGTPTLIEGQG